jgi:glycosyltransferase involved in cell wall biosynthesis
MKIAYVVPRYGPQIRGGAETGARMLAEHLVTERSWEVEVFTTCALDALTWADELSPGTELINGVQVHRIASQAGRDEGFHPFSGALLQSPETASLADAEIWVDLQGPKSPDLVEAVAASDAEVVAFYPYLYYPTIRGVPRVADRAIMHPAAHDEPPIRLPVFPPVFQQVRGLVFQTRSERRMVLERFKVGATPQVLVGLGVDEVDGSADEARRALDLPDVPYLLCIGRVDDKKGTGILWRYFRSYKERHPGPLKLVLVGQVIDAPEPHPDIVVTGMVDDQVKWGLLRGAAVLVSPSPWEAFSITVIEGMTAGVPVVVNAGCDATREHCERSGAGLWFGGFAEFEVVLDRLLGDRALRETLRRRGLRYVATHYRWPVIVDRYASFLERVAVRTRG